MLNDTTNNYLKACEDWRLKFICHGQRTAHGKITGT